MRIPVMTRKQSNQRKVLGGVRGVRHLALWAIVLTATLAFAKPHKISKDLKEALGKADPNSTVDVIVQFKDGVHDDAKTQKLANHRGFEKKKLKLVKGSAATVPVSALQDLENDPDVAYISPDRPVQGSDVSVTGGASVATTNAAFAWEQGWDGTGIGVAVIDSGIVASQQDLKNKIVFSDTWISGSTNDQYGHGTVVAGILSGSGSASSGKGYFQTFRGVAPGASLINLRVLGKNGSGRDSDVIAAIQEAVWLKRRYNIRVINLSLGRPVFESYTQDPLCQAVEEAWKAGIVVVVAAGNDGRNNNGGNLGYGTINAPGNDPYVITVGGMKDNGTPDRSDDTIASYSSKGPTLIDNVVKPDLVAPGNRVIAAQGGGVALAQYDATDVLYSEYKQGSNNSVSTSYMRLSGTSMAAPMVSGAVALLLQADPQLTPDQAKIRLMETASKSFPLYSTGVDPTTGATYTSEYDIFTVGAGYLDIAAALTANDRPTGTALSPTSVYDPGSGIVSLSPDPSSAWGSSVLWGTSVVWGSQVLSGNSVLWGTSVVWGNSVMWGSSVAWGSSVTWGANTSQGFSVLWGANSTSASSVLWGASADDMNGLSVLTGSEN